MTRFACAIALVAATALSSLPRAAEAQAVDPSELGQVKATPKGTIGLGLIGAELGLIIPSVAGLNKAWALSVFPIVGAAGGAVGGYFGLDKPGREKGSVAVLVVGVAGVLPAVLVTVKGVRKERQERWEPVQEIQIRSKEEQRAVELAEAGTGLLRMTRSGLRAATPEVTVSLRTPNTLETIRRGGLRERREVRLSLFSGVF